MNYGKITTEIIIEGVAVDESIMEPLIGINGYMGGAVNNYTGECLVCDSTKISGNLEEVSATFNDVFRDAHKISKSLQLGATEIMELRTEKAIILMACSGEDARVHLHIFAIFSKDGNVALGKMALDKVVRTSVEALS